MPDKTVALNFFQLAPVSESANPETHSEQLKKISELFTQTPTSFRPIVFSESRVSLYGNIEKNGDYYLGTLVKNQVSNIPPSYDEAASLISILPLTENQGLAYQTSFLFHPSTNIVMIESIKNGVGIKTLCDFLNLNYNIDPVEPLIVINPSKLQDFYNMGYISKFQVKISRLESGSIFQANKKTALGKIIESADETNTNTIDYTLTARKKTGSLKRSRIGSIIRSLLRYKDGDEVKKLIVTGQEDEDGAIDTIDFIEHKLTDRISVKRERLISSFDTKEHYEKLVAVYNVLKPSLGSYKVKNR